MLELKRFSDWRPRLFAFTAGLKTLSFAWGHDDCAVALAAGAIEAMTGTDPAEPYRGRYDDEDSARSLLAEMGHSGLDDLARSMLPETHISMARVGDIAFLKEGSEVGALGIVIGARILVLRPAGTGTVPLLTAQTAFKVG
ncbi:DUF6950 family protein [Martelella mediterranea]|nr:hypothetical protein [Martelella mediterranea]